MKELHDTIDGLHEFAELERAQRIESLIITLPAPLFTGLYYESIMQIWCGIEQLLVQSIEWAIKYYMNEGIKKKADRLMKQASRLFPTETSYL